jgi:hypothetical protein
VNAPLETNALRETRTGVCMTLWDPVLRDPEEIAA